MLDFPRWRVTMLNALIVLSILLAIPSFLPKAWLDRIPAGVPKETISLGLDLAGAATSCSRLIPHSCSVTVWSRSKTITDCP